MGPRRSPEPSRVLRAALAGLLLAGGLATRAAEEATPASGGALRVAVEPPRLVLGDDPGADVTIAAPPDVEELTVVTSAGRIENVRRLASGGFAARLRPPAERYPQVAIVAAIGRGASGPVDGWVAVPLFGQGDARVRATPGTAITLRIGERSFGPRDADSSGNAVIPVVVPPGVREAHHGFKPIDLHVPDTPLLLAVAERATVRADRAEQVRILAYVVAPHGAARRGDVPTFEPSRGAVAVAAREPGAFEATWTIPPGPSGEERVVVRLPGSAPSRTVLKVASTVGPPATVAVAFDRDVVAADGPREVALRVRVLDAAGNVSPGAVEVTADGASVSGLAERQPGVWEGRLEVPARLAGRTEAVVTARGATAGVGGSRALALRPGAPATIDVDDTPVIADGATEAAIRLAVHDRFGNPVTTPPAVAAARGRVLGVTADGPGVCRVVYVGPPTAARGEDTLTVEVGPARTSRPLVLLAPRPRLTALVSGGVVPGSPLGARAALGVEWAGPEMRSVAVAWSGGAETLLWAGRGEALAHDERLASARDARAGAVALLGGATVSRDLALGPTVWASGGVGLAVAWVGAGGTTDTGVGPAARLAVGAGWRARLVSPFVEASVLAAAGTPVRTFPAFALSAGLRFDLQRIHGDHPHRR